MNLRTTDIAGLRPPDVKAGKTEWMGLGILLLVCLLAAMDGSVLYLALPMISADLAPSGAAQLWIMDVYGLVLAGLLIPMGALGDRIGRRRLLLLGAAAFGAAELASAFAVNAGMLIAARALLGVAGAMLMPSALALIRGMFQDAQQRRVAIALWTAGASSGAALGPIAGGMLLNHFWWGSVFLISVPAILVLLALGPALLPEVRNTNNAGLDLASAVLALGAVLSALYGIKDIATNGLGVLSGAALVAGIALGAVFLRRQGILQEPMLDLRLFRARGFGAALVLNLLAMFVMIGFSQYTSQYLQVVAGLEPLASALWSLPAYLMMIVAASGSAALTRIVPRAHVIGAGFVLTTAGMVFMTQLPANAPLMMVLCGATPLAAGVGMAIALCSDLIVSSAPQERAGSAAAVSEASKEFGGALGTAVLGSIGAVAYAGHMISAAPGGLPPDAARAARETLGGAAGAAEQLPPPMGDALLAAAQDAFVHQMNIVAIVAAVVVLIGAIVATTVLRRFR